MAEVRQSPSTFRGVALSEAVVILGASAASYLFTFAAERAYLSYFGISEIYATIDLARVAVSGFYLVTAVVLLWNILSIMSPNFLSNIAIIFLKLFYIFLAALVAYVLWKLGVDKNGVVKHLFQFPAFSIFVFCAYQIGDEVWRICSSLYEKRGLSGWRKDALDEDARIRAHTLAKKLDETTSGRVFVTVIVGLALVLPVGQLVGERRASKENSYLTFADRGKKFAIVAETRGIFIAVGVVEIYEDSPVYLQTGAIKFLSAEKLDRISADSALIRLERR